MDANSNTLHRMAVNLAYRSRVGTCVGSSQSVSNSDVVQHIKRESHLFPAMHLLLLFDLARCPSSC